MNPGQKVKFIGIIDMPQFKPCETEIIRKSGFNMYFIEHEQGEFDTESGKRLLFVGPNHLEENE